MNNTQSNTGIPSDRRRQTHVIVTGNEKGGSGKTTVAMHLVVALLRSGHSVGAIDLDIRQKSFTRYLENRAKWGLKHNLGIATLPFPQISTVPHSTTDSRAQAHAEETQSFTKVMGRFANFDFLVIDCPGADTHLSRLAHAHADTIVTPMNDSFVDFDLLAVLDPETNTIDGPSIYAEQVWRARQTRANAGLMGGIDWVVLRNRIGAANARNKKRVGEKLQDLSERIGFKLHRGFGERVIYREMFPMGLTLLDLSTKPIATLATMRASSVSHVAARTELRSFLSVLKLPLAKRDVIATALPEKTTDTAMDISYKVA